MDQCNLVCSVIVFKPFQNLIADIVKHSGVSSARGMVAFNQNYGSKDETHGMHPFLATRALWNVATVMILERYVSHLQK
jgi:hypothetical protein